MEYFVSHLPAIFIAGCVVALAAVVWWLLLEKQANDKRERVKARQNNINKDNKNLGK